MRVPSSSSGSTGPTRRSTALLVQYQWEDLEDAVDGVGLDRSEFCRESRTARERHFVGKVLRPLLLPMSEWHARFFHSVFDSVYILLEYKPQAVSEDCDDGAWMITMEPAPSGAPGVERRQVAGWRDVVDVAQEWAEIAAREVIASRRAARNVLGAWEALFTDAGFSPLEIEQISTVIDEVVPKVVQESAASAGETDQAKIRKQAVRLRRDALVELPDLLLRGGREHLTESFKSWAISKTQELGESGVRLLIDGVIQVFKALGPGR